MDQQFIVIYGNPAEGFTYVGPFASHDDAVDYAQVDNAPSDWWIILLQQPAESN